MTALRQRYIDDLRLRNKSPRTIETYVLRVAQFARHFGRSPEHLDGEAARAYQQHLIARQVSWSMFNQSVCALRFLYNVTLGRPEVIQHLPFAKRPRQLPSVLSAAEVVRLLEAALPGRDRTLVDVAYSCGLRLKELLGPWDPDRATPTALSETACRPSLPSFTVTARNPAAIPAP
jgi:integrase/recombinase XerD